ncbi:hypothetical protein AB205_0087690 [Aquarana catesbeiana]|uniref:G-protein coupled receptors family 1 profile domain-containing protein n=1 Tax=Aquarana catesbeiana TaxID=8400 RepID=A0A2G9QHZ8_AQUCT|nr:hypothetical protein AB205_0087690 [Aquarana catesbeiana]
MSHLNKTKVIMFVFSGLTHNEQLAPFLFTFFLNVYLVCVVFNFGMMFIVLKASNLHTPMYYFLSYLSLVDLFYSSVIAPKMLADLMSKIKFPEKWKAACLRRETEVMQLIIEEEKVHLGEINKLTEESVSQLDPFKDEPEFNRLNELLRKEGDIDGCTMGTGICLHLELWEEQVVYHLPLYCAHAATWAHYIDDVLVVWMGTVEELEEFMMELNGNDRIICFTYNFHYSKISFLDLSISIDQGRLSTCTFRKEMQPTLFCIPQVTTLSPLFDGY